jgi:hypothetical protein
MSSIFRSPAERGAVLRYYRQAAETGSMKPESEPVADDEFVLRLVWHAFFRPGADLCVLPRAFHPRDDETTGISVYRVACLDRPADVLSVIPRRSETPITSRPWPSRACARSRSLSYRTQSRRFRDMRFCRR